MGFLDRILKKEARKLVAGVLDEVVDSVTDNIRDSIRENKSGTTIVNTVSTNESGAESDCCFDPKVVAERIQNVVSEEWGDRIEVRKNVKSSELGAEAGALDYTYGLYSNGAPVAMIIILDPPTDDYWNKRTRLAREACERQGVGYVHFITRLPNRTSYIREQLKKIVHI